MLIPVVFEKTVRKLVLSYVIPVIFVCKVDMFVFAVAILVFAAAILVFADAIDVISPLNWLLISLVTFDKYPI